MVRHVVNPRRRGSWRCIARNHKRIRAAKDPITLGACITDDLHSKEIRIEVTRLRVVVDLIREVVDGNGLEPFDSSSDAAAAMRARLLISWRRVTRPRSKSSSNLATTFSIFVLHAEARKCVGRCY